MLRTFNIKPWLLLSLMAVAILSDSCKKEDDEGGIGTPVHLLSFGPSPAIRGGNLNGPTLKAALENITRIYYGVVATYERPFSLNDKDAITQNMLVMGKVANGRVTFARPEDAKRSLVVKRKS